MAKLWGVFRYDEGREGELLIQTFSKKGPAFQEKDRLNSEFGSRWVEYVVRGVKEKQLAGLVPPVVRMADGALVSQGG